MASDWIRVTPYLKWSVLCGLAGAGAFLYAGAVRQNGWPDRLVWDEQMELALVGGFAAGALAGTFLMVLLQVRDRASKDVREHSAAEHRDPRIVTKMLFDVESGDETAAWHAIALLANYRDALVARRMLESLSGRLGDPKVVTLDRLALVRHAVKSVVAADDAGAYAEIQAYAGDMDSPIGVEVRRLRHDVKDVSLQ